MNNRPRKKWNKGIIALISIIILLAAVIGNTFLLKYKKVVEGNYNGDIENTGDNEAKDNSLSSNSISEDSANRESNSSIEDSAYLEKYIQQQVKGEMPDGADGKKVAYLTFDDGPSQQVTPEILDILNKEKVNATFFVVGKNVDAYKDLVKRENEEGNTVAIHSYSHDYHYLFPGNKINIENCMADFEKTDKAIKDVLGEDYNVRALRFPGGHMSWSKNDPEGAEAVDKKIHEKDWHQIDWNCLSGDAESITPRTADQLYDEAVKTIGTREKAVILMHDEGSKHTTAEALPRIIEYLKQQGYEFKTIQ